MVKNMTHCVNYSRDQKKISLVTFTTQRLPFEIIQLFHAMKGNFHKGSFALSSCQTFY